MNFRQWSTNHQNIDDWYSPDLTPCDLLLSATIKPCSGFIKNVRPHFGKQIPEMLERILEDTVYVNKKLENSFKEALKWEGV